MTCYGGVLAIWVIVAADPSVNPEGADVSSQATWAPVFDRVAAEYELHAPQEPSKLELMTRPVYRWARPGPNGGTNGAVYVWTRSGCAEAVACFWRSAPDGKDLIAHELHSLSPAVLKSTRGGPNQWKPQAALNRQLVPGAPAPASSPAARLQQARTLSRDFSASSVSSRGERTELRLLPQPLYRYQSTNDDISDGALFAFVCSVGTDPEIFLLLESLQTDDGPRWHYAAARFSHLNLFVNYKERAVWQSVRDSRDTIARNADHTYWLFHEELPEKLP
jgi:hypothetical protein